MRIDNIEVVPFSIPLRVPSRWGSHGSRDSQDHVLIRIRTDDGAVGIAEAPARPTIFGETQRSIVHIIRDTLAPMLIGRNPLDRESIRTLCDAVPYNFTAKGALDIALHDVAAQHMGVTLCEMLGGSPRPVEVSYLLNLNVEKGIGEDALKVRSETGIRAFKVKAGRDPAGDVARVKELREALGPSGFIFVDANQLYSPEVAIRTINQMAEHDLAMAEEPVSIDLGPWRKKVADAITVPILSDDSVITLAAARRELQEGAIGIIGIKTARTGIHDSVRILHLAEAFGLPCWVGSQGVSGIGALASAHFAAAFRNIPYPADLTAFLRQEDDLLAEPLRAVDGKISLPNTPGIGAEINEEKLRRYRVE